MSRHFQRASHLLKKIRIAGNQILYLMYILHSLYLL